MADHLTGQLNNSLISSHYRPRICRLNTQRLIQQLSSNQCRLALHNQPPTTPMHLPNQSMMFSNLFPKLLSCYCFLLFFLCLYICCKLYKTVVNAANPANAVATSDNVTSAATFKKIDAMHIPNDLLST